MGASSGQEPSCLSLCFAFWLLFLASHQSHIIFKDQTTSQLRVELSNTWVSKLHLRNKWGWKSGKLGEAGGCAEASLSLLPTFNFPGSQQYLPFRALASFLWGFWRLETIGSFMQRVSWQADAVFKGVPNFTCLHTALQCLLIPGLLRTHHRTPLTQFQCLACSLCCFLYPLCWYNAASSQSLSF